MKMEQLKTGRIKKNWCQQKIYGIWQIVVKMKFKVINKISHNLKMMHFKMPNAAYSNRWRQAEKNRN